MTDTIQGTSNQTPELPPERPMPRLGRGGVWSETIAEIARDQAKRQRRLDEDATPSLGDGLEQLGVAPSELPVAPSLGVGGTEGGGGAPTDAELEQLGAQLDEADFAEALDSLGAGTLKLAQNVHAIAETLHECASYLQPEPVPLPPSRRGWGIRFRRRAR